MKRDEKLLRSMVSELVGLQVLALQLGTGDMTLKLLSAAVRNSALVFTEALRLLADEMGVSEDATLEMVDAEREIRMASLRKMAFEQALHPTGKLDG